MRAPSKECWIELGGWRNDGRRARLSAEELCVVLGRRKTNSGLDQIEFGLNVCDPLELHIENRLLSVEQHALLSNQVPLLTDLRLKIGNANGKWGGHRE